MITLTVVSLDGTRPASAPSASFDELGGTIGRADHNQLVLSDPERVVSRVHARVVYRAGAYALANQGSNPVLVNGRPVVDDHETPLGDGDEVRIGGFVLRAQRSAPTRSGRGIEDPFTDLMGRPVFDARPAMPAPAPAASAAGGIPIDWDPFAPESKPFRSQTMDFAQALGGPGGTGGTDALGLDGGAAAPAVLAGGPDGIGRGGEDSLDVLFGLRPGTGGDPLAHSRLDAPVAGPNMAANPDPRKSLRSPPLASAATAPDDLSDLWRSYAPPPASDPIVATTPTLTPEILAHAVLSWDAPDGRSRTVIQPPARAEAPIAPVAPPPAAGGDDVPTAFPGAMAPAAEAPPPATVEDRVPALLAALRVGLEAPQLRLDRLTPEVMQLIGRLLHECARGTVDLLVVRAAQKREVRAEATMIVTRENNPLKFSPNAEVALQHLLSPTLSGFMTPVAALRDAYDDLGTHQSGCVAGLRTAFAGAFARFEPAALERQLGPPSGLHALLPARRKAALWDAFVAHHARMAADAGHDGDGLIGPDLLRACDTRIAPHGQEPT